MSRTRLGLLAGIAVTGLVGGYLAPQAFAEPSPVARDVQVWLTDLSSGTRLERQPDLAWRAGQAPGDRTIAVDERRKYQRMTGFGASFTDSSAWLVGTRLSSADRDAVMRDLFSPTDGIGLSFVRQPMGASDFAVEGNYSYDDMPAGQTDPELQHFSVEHDDAYIVPVLRQALRLNPDLTLMASPWSPPGWMKTSDSMIGGTLKREAYQPLAEYFAKFVEAYAARGVPIDYITPNNEPLYVPEGYPGMSLSQDQAADLIREHLGPTLRERGLDAEILGYDHNWQMRSYPESLYADRRTSREVAGTAWHCYEGDVRSQSVSHNNYPKKPAFHTECSGGEWEGDTKAGFEGAMNLVVNAPREWAKGVVRWNMALDADNGPTNGGCTTCRGLVTVRRNANGDWSYQKTVDYYALGHASKFVRPGARRIASNSLGNGVQDVAYVNPDGSKALVAYNSGDRRRTFRVQWGDRWLTYVLAPGAAATFTWDGRQDAAADADTIGSVDLAFRDSDGSRPVVSYDAGLRAYEEQVRIDDEWHGYTLPTGASLRPDTPGTALPRGEWTASAIANAPEDPVANAIDGKPSTRWSTGRGMRPGDWFELDLGAKRRFDELVVDAGASIQDFARSYEIRVSGNGNDWRPVARGTGQTVTTVRFPPVEARYVRIVNRGTSGSWWSIHELKLYGHPDGTATTNDARGMPNLQHQKAELPDGTEVRAVYNAGRSPAEFDVELGSTTYTYTLPPSAAAVFTRPSG